MAEEENKTTETPEEEPEKESAVVEETAAEAPAAEAAEVGRRARRLCKTRGTTRADSAPARAS